MGLSRGCCGGGCNPANEKKTGEKDKHGEGGAEEMCLGVGKGQDNGCPKRK